MTKDSGTYLGYRDEYGREMHCSHAKCPHQEKCIKGCSSPAPKLDAGHPAQGSDAKPVAWICYDLSYGEGHYEITKQADLAARRKTLPDMWRVEPLYRGTPAEGQPDSGTLEQAAELTSLAEEFERSAAVQTIHRAGRRLPVGSAPKIAEALRFRASAILGSRSPAETVTLKQRSEADAYYKILKTIARFPITDPKNMDAVNMRLIAEGALSLAPADRSSQPETSNKGS